MIEAIADLFVEKVPRAAARPVLATASRLLVVNACGRPRRIPELIALVEDAAPVTGSVVDFDQIDVLPTDSVFEVVWLFVDEQSDLKYCGLYMRELAERFGGARIETIGVGGSELAGCLLTLPESSTGSASPWRRKRELARGAELLGGALA